MLQGSIYMITLLLLDIFLCSETQAQQEHLKLAMAQERGMFLSHDLIFHFSDDNEAAEKDDFVFDIDPSLIVNIDQLIIDELAGEGPLSIVYKGRYEFRPVSIKVMLPEKTSNATSECKARFQREVNLISRINHKNVVKFIGASVEPSMMIISELSEGCSLQKHLEGIYPRTLDMEQTLSFALDISQAMEHLHANGIIHRDLNPGNLFLDEHKRHIKLGEFGMAIEEVNGDMPCEAGTYLYVAPELFSKDPLQEGENKRYDHKTDVYSFAVVLWVLVKNQTPFKGRNDMMAAYAAAQHMRPSVEDFPNYLIPLLQSCWAEDPMNRPEFRKITKTLKKLVNNCSIAGTTLPYPVPEVEDIYKQLVDEAQSHKSQKSNGCSDEEQYSNSMEQSFSPVLDAESNPNEKVRKHKSSLICFCKCLAKF